jgi:hypothetical protein
MPSGREADGSNDIVVVFQNDTNGPVYTWTALVFVDPPAREFEFGSEVNGVIPPHGGRLEIPLHEIDAGQVIRSEIEFSYTLAEGVSWRRERDGRLEQMFGNVNLRRH